jgi:hypothetical protein
LTVYIDFEKDLQAKPLHPQAMIEQQANSWVRLNERQPRDRLEIGGFVRNQGVADAGLFKWFTNTTRAGDTGGGVVPVAQAIKRILANATIDEFITYEGEFTGVKQYYGSAGSPGYFTNQTGEYANVFEISLPPDVESVVLRALDWTSYYPTLYTDSRTGSFASALRVTPIQCEVFYNASQPAPPPFSEPWRDPEVPNRLGGRRVSRPGGGIEGQNAEVVYKFRMEPGVSQSGGATSGGRVQTPVIDDVTLTYYLSSPKILLQEETD